MESQDLKYAVLGCTDTPLSDGILNVCTEAGILFNEIRFYAESLGQLNVDAFLLVVNPENRKFEIIIAEVKDVASLGLKEYSQLMGYCLSSYSSYGLLINVNNGASKNLTDLLVLDKDLSSVTRLKHNGASITHEFGVFRWNTTNSRLESLELGKIRSISEMIIRICGRLK